MKSRQEPSRKTQRFPGFILGDDYLGNIFALTPFSLFGEEATCMVKDHQCLRCLGSKGKFVPPSGCSNGKES